MTQTSPCENSKSRFFVSISPQENLKGLHCSSLRTASDEYCGDFIYKGTYGI